MTKKYQLLNEAAVAASFRLGRPAGIRELAENMREHGFILSHKDLRDMGTNINRLSGLRRVACDLHEARPPRNPVEQTATKSTHTHTAISIPNKLNMIFESHPIETDQEPIDELLLFANDLIDTLAGIEGKEELAEAYAFQLLAIRERAVQKLSDEYLHLVERTLDRATGEDK